MPESIRHLELQTPRLRLWMPTFVGMTEKRRHAGLDPASRVTIAATSMPVVVGMTGEKVRMRERQPAVYIVASQRNGTIYTGVTSNLIGRMLQHRAGAFNGFAKKHKVKLLVWYDVADTMDAAITREKQLKNWRREWKLALIEKDNPTWRDLAVDLGLDPIGHAGSDS